MLPDETLLEAFSFLSHYGLNIAVIVCRNWKRAIYLLDDEERNTGREDSDDDVNPFFLGYPRSQRKRRRVQKAPRPVLYYMRVVDGTASIIKQLPPHHDLEHQLTLASVDVNDVRFSVYNFRELRISCNSIMEGQLLGRLLQKFPSLRTVREIEVEYPYSNRNLSIMFRRLKALTHLRRLCITPRDPTRGFQLSSRADEDAFLGFCLRRGPYLPADCTREVDVQYFVSRRFLLRLIEAFKTVVGRTTIDVLHRPQPTALEQWLCTRRKRFLYSGSDVVKSTLMIQDKKGAHVSVWYKCTESNISFLHFGYQFFLSNNPMLPDETLQESFSFLSHYGLNVAMIVCRRWKRVVYDFEFDDRVYCYYDEWTDSYRREKRARSYRLKAPIRLPHHIHVDGDVVRILNARKYHEDTVRQHVVWSDIDANDVRFSGFEFLELKASLKFGEPSLEGLLDKFPSLRTVQVAEIEYGFPVDGGGISLRRLKEFTHLRQLNITQRQSRDEFWLGRADEDGLLDVCVRRSPRLPAKEGRTITVQCLVSRRFLLQLIEAFETIVGSTTVEVYYEHQPTLLEEWLGIEKDYFDYGGPISMKSKLVIKKGSVDHTAVWYKCRDSNVAFAHYRKHFVVTNDPTEVTSRIHRLVNFSLDVEGW